MSRYYNTALKYKAFAQTEVITKSGLTPVSIIGTGVGSMTLAASKLRVGSTLRITQTGKMTSGTGTTGAVTFKVNDTTAFGTAGTLPNSLNDAGLEAVWNITVKAIDVTNITFQVAVHSAINSTAFVNVFNRVACVEVVVPIASSYVFDLLYNFNDANGIIKVGQTIFEVGY